MSARGDLISAANQIREDVAVMADETDSPSDRFLLAVAARLETAAHQWERVERDRKWPDSRKSTVHLEDDLAIARAYLEGITHVVELVASRGELWVECSCGATATCGRGEEFGRSGHSHNDECLPLACPETPGGGA